jgi:hypothetical protein
MLKFSIKAELDKVKDLMKKSPQIFQEEKKAVLTEAGLLLESEWKSRAPTGATGSQETASQLGRRLNTDYHLNMAQNLTGHPLRLLNFGV